MCIHTCWNWRAADSDTDAHQSIGRIQVMLIPPREYVERWFVKPSRPYYR